MNSQILPPMPSLHNILNRLRLIFTHIFVITLTITSSPGLINILVGAFFIIFGGSLRIWASGYINKGVELAQGGPYSLCRHPLYLGSFLIGSGFCFASNRWWSFILLLMLFIIFYYPVMLGEEKFLIKHYGKVYKDYIRCVPRFIPKFWNLSITSGSFKWHLVLKNREHWQILTIFLLYLLMLFK